MNKIIIRLFYLGVKGKIEDRDRKSDISGQQRIINAEGCHICYLEKGVWLRNKPGICKIEIKSYISPSAAICILIRVVVRQSQI
jgi:hypothetical protein